MSWKGHQFKSLVKPAACAEALERQLRGAFRGKTSDEVCALLEIPELQEALMEFRLLSHVQSDRVWGQDGEDADSGEGGFFTSVLLQVMPCFGRVGRGRSLLGGGRGLPDLRPLLQQREAVEALLAGGGSRDWRLAVEAMCRLLAGDPECAQGGWRLRLAAATALCQAEGETDANHHVEPIDLSERYLNFCQWAKQGLLFSEFRSLTTWQMRYAVGSWHADSCLVWAREHVDQQYRKPESVGMAARMVRYRDFNDNGVSVQDGLRFYDGKAATMPVINEYGGVCGAVSKFGAGACHAFGVPAMPVAQPGHCALIWRGPGGKWELENDCSGWNKTWMHAGIQRTWGSELGPGCEAASIVPVMERAQASLEDYLASERLRWAAQLRCVEQTSSLWIPGFASGDHDAAEPPTEEAEEAEEFPLALLARAAERCPHNLPAWTELLHELQSPPLPAPGGRPSGAARRSLLRARAAAAEGKVAGRRHDLGRLRPVAASADHGRAANIVDGTDSEWFPDTPAEPQWLQVDLQRPCLVEAVRVKWWGDYGSRNSLRVLSARGVDGADFVRRGVRERAADFNGWTELRGWDGPTRLVRLELGSPGPDCFGLGKQYGIRRVEILGRQMPCAEDPAQDCSSLLVRWAEAAFAELDLADTQALQFLRAKILAGACWEPR